MEAVYIEMLLTGERVRLENPVWLTTNRNGILATPHRVKALGVSDGMENYSFGTLAGCPEARIITRAEYEETGTAQDPDPVLTAEEAMKIMMGGSYETQ